MFAGLLSRFHAPVAGVGDQPELRGQHHLVAAALQRPADQFLVDVRAVDLGGVDERDAQFERPVDGPDGFVVVAARAGVAVDMPIAPRPIRDTARSPSLMYFMSPGNRLRTRCGRAWRDGYCQTPPALLEPT